MGLSDIFNAGKIKEENESLKQQLAELQAEKDSLSQKYDSMMSGYRTLKQEHDSLLQSLTEELQDSIRRQILSLQEQKAEAKQELQAVQEELVSIQSKIQPANAALKAINQALKATADNKPNAPQLNINAAKLLAKLDDLHLNCLDVPTLRKMFNANKANVRKIIQKYESRYTTKANQSIYQLMVLGLEAELQNVMLNLRFGTVQKAKDQIKELTQRYYEIAANGNQSIAPTVKSFIIEIEAIYMEAVEIEYEYYTQKEKIKEEQRALREQMRQEAEERRILEQQQKQIEKEEQKYKNEIENVKTAMAYSNAAEIENLQRRLAELEAMLSKVEDKKEEIVKLQNGQAGYVYVISNVGSFGDNIFKVGMTRRLEPQERVDELGNASVPFPFDVHSFIFSENAVELENRLHKILDQKRVNKVNKRKEFFSISVQELEHLVHEIDPSAEFKLTALAEQYNQSLSIA